MFPGLFFLGKEIQIRNPLNHANNKKTMRATTNKEESL